MRRIALSVIVLLSVIFCEAKVILPSVFSDNMVLQQKSKVKIWGSSNKGQVQITTSWDKKKYISTVGLDGRWEVNVQTPSYGGPYQVTIDDGEPTVLKNILVGDVWVCSGQSNMEMPLAGWGKVNNYIEEIKQADYPNIRFIQVQKKYNNLPQDDAALDYPGWQTVSPQSIPEFSSTAYFFAREVYLKTGIPIGLIHTSWGGTVAEAWTSGETLKDFVEFKDAVARLSSKDAQTVYENQLKAWNDELMKNDKGNNNGSYPWLSPNMNDKDWASMAIPGLWDTNTLPNFDGVVYFRKHIEIPSKWLGKKLTLHLGMIDDEDITFWNGQQVGSTQGYNQSRVYEIPAAFVTSREVTIGIRVFDGGGGGGIYGDNAALKIVGPDNEEISLASNWKYKIGVSLNDLSPKPVSNDGANRPTVLFNAMINPFIPYGIKGVIWYQGEANADRAHQYRTLFPALIKDWRKKWNLSDFPFYYVQLANYMPKEENPTFSAWAELRDAQKDALALPNTGMAVIADIGEAEDIHPRNKQDVGKRLALLALNKTYKKVKIGEGPTLISTKIKDDKIYLKFDPKGKKLVNREPKSPILKGFTIAGKDEIFYNAEATLKGNTIIVKSNQVKNPVSVRYGWANNPDLSLYNEVGLPASPFKTDTWKDSTSR